ncbi:MAG: hypothetical protein VR65_26685 [Desulfobulbaceae bacterium BRH_c16a]|nr:MAG: hypothetical protein VR65_26685 [Desulfobulbaceae bacterium BRH_c16a]
MSTYRKILAAVFLSLLTFATVSCERDKPAETTGETRDSAVENTGERTGEVGEAREEKAEEAPTGTTTPQPEPGQTSPQPQQ